jgi:hypothetical protein
MRTTFFFSLKALVEVLFSNGYFHGLNDGMGGFTVHDPEEFSTDLSKLGSWSDDQPSFWRWDHSVSRETVIAVLRGKMLSWRGNSVTVPEEGDKILMVFDGSYELLTGHWWGIVWAARVEVNSWDSHRWVWTGKEVIDGWKKSRTDLLSDVHVTAQARQRVNSLSGYDLSEELAQYGMFRAHNPDEVWTGGKP